MWHLYNRCAHLSHCRLHGILVLVVLYCSHGTLLAYVYVPFNSCKLYRHCVYGRPQNICTHTHTHKTRTHTVARETCSTRRTRDACMLSPFNPTPLSIPPSHPHHRLSRWKHVYYVWCAHTHTYTCVCASDMWACKCDLMVNLLRQARQTKLRPITHYIAHTHTHTTAKRNDANAYA